jgi:oligopeptide/dipeptide ABC transporter ATP-binding protein
MTATPLVEIRGLLLRAGPVRILRGIDLDIGRGRILGVVGESGSGKSSLAAALLRLLPAGVRAEGSIRFDGIDLLSLDEPAMRALRGTRLAMIFQDPMGALNPLFTVGAHLVEVVRRREPRIARRAALARAADMLGRVAMPDPAARLRQYPHELSGGMRQRVVIAMALLAAPDLLLADEPTTALDATIEAQVVALFATLRRELVVSAMFISHQLGLVAALCDDVCVLYGGLVLETGPVGDVLATPAHPYTQALLAAEIMDAAAGARLASIPGTPPDPRSDPPGCLFAPRCGLAIARCHGERPALRASSTGRSAACHLLEQPA